MCFVACCFRVQLIEDQISGKILILRKSFSSFVLTCGQKVFGIHSGVFLTAITKTQMWTMHLSHLTVLLLSCQTQNAQLFSLKMSYKLDLRKQVANLFGRLSSSEIVNVFNDKPISRSTIYNVSKDCHDGKEQENKKKSGRPPKLSAGTTKNLLSSAKNKVGHLL